MVKVIYILLLEGLHQAPRHEPSRQTSPRQVELLISPRCGSDGGDSTAADAAGIVVELVRNISKKRIHPLGLVKMSQS